MPIFTYLCDNCQIKFKKLLNKRESTQKCQKCGFKSKVQIPTTVNSITYETTDNYRGAKAQKDVQAKLKDRSRKHSERYEMEEKIDRYGLDEAVKNGWTEKRKR